MRQEDEAVKRAGLLAVVLGLWLALAAPLASAVEVAHAPEGSFDGAGTPGGPFQAIFGVDVDNSGGPGDGAVWVADLRVDEEAEALLGMVFELDEEGVYAGTTLDGSETPDGSFGFFEQEGSLIAADPIAVDGSSGPNGGDIYVADLAHGVVNRFDEDGSYVCQVTGRAVPSASECGGLAGSATPAGGISPTAVAVDAASGDLYVADGAHAVVDVFDSSGHFVRQIADSHLTLPGAMAIDSSGTLYVADGSVFGGGSVVKLDAAGSFVSVLDEAAAVGVAVDPANEHVYVSHLTPEGIAEFDAAGNPLGSFGSGEPPYMGLAVNRSTGRLYAATFPFQGPAVDMFSPVTGVPAVEAAAPSAVTDTTATLSGQVDPDGLGDVVSCRFEYGTDGGFQHSVPCTPAAPYSSPTAVTAAVSGLSPATAYEFRLAAANGGVAPYTRGVFNRTPAQTFRTTGPPSVGEESVGDLEKTSATLRASVNPNGFDTEYRFQIVDQASFEADGYDSPATRSTVPVPIGDGVDPVPVAQPVDDLEVGTTYHFRAVAENAHGVTFGGDRQFTTEPVAVIARQWAYARVSAATVEADVNPLGLESGCLVQYVDDASFLASGFAQAKTAPCASGPGSGTDDATVAAEIEGLEIDTEYRFRFIVTNASGILIGEDATFSTFGIESFSVELFDEEGNPYTQAGGHPYVKVISYRFNHTTVPTGNGSTGSLSGFIKDLIAEEAPGETAASLEKTPACPGHAAEELRCPPETQVGEVKVEFLNGAGISKQTKPIFNITPPEGVANRYATVDPFFPSDSEIRSGGDYGMTIGNFDVTEDAGIVGVTSTIWGIPSDHNGGGGPRSVTLRNPTSCRGPRTTRVRADSWQAPGRFSAASTQLPPVTGCDELEFHPSIEWQPTTKVADSPTGLHVDIHQDQRGDPDELDYADLRNVQIQPSDGVLLNPAGAAGLGVCSPAQIGLDREGPANCPEDSKIGKVQIVTPLVDEPLRGGIYMATPHDNPFDSMFAIYLAVDDADTGVAVKLPGQISTEGEAGGISASFSDNPELPVEDFVLDFFGGPHAVLRTALRCGTYETEALLTPWSAPQSGPPARRTDSFELSTGPGGGPCPASEAAAPHQPRFRAGTLSTVAGAYSPFVMHLERQDGTQRIAALSLTPPPGLLGRLTGISRCAEEALARAEGRTGAEERANPSCPADSRVGGVVVGAGAGPDPLEVAGEVYLGGPYKGAPISLAVVVPAVAGPFDLGTVVVRTPLLVNLETGQIGVQSDPIPSVLGGVSLDVRSITLKLDRPDFTLNPTNCDPLATRLSVPSLAGQSLLTEDPFQVFGCGKLRFAPKIGMRLLGSHRRRGHPALRTVLTLPKGNANIARMTVTLPPTQFLDNAHLRGICTRPQFAERTCPVDTAYGYARAWSPLLPKPLEGPVYMRSSTQRLPNLVAELNGEVRIAVAGHVGSADGGIRVNVEDLPDAAVSRFVMQMQGGERGLLQNSIDLCRRPQRATVEMEAQSGKVVVRHPRLRVGCPRPKAARPEP